MEPKKTKKVLIKKKKATKLNDKTEENLIIPSPLSNRELESKKEETNEFNLNSNIFGFLGQFQKNMKEGIETALKDIPDNEKENLSSQDLFKKVTNHIATNLPNTLPKQSFDLGSVMSTLMEGAEKMVLGKIKPENSNTVPVDKSPINDPNSPPSVFDQPPEMPTDRSKYFNPDEEKKQHIIYKGFNVTLLSTLTMLSEKLPEKKNLYDKIRKIIENVIDIDPTKPRELWKKSVEGREDKLRKYSLENVEYICKNLHTIELLSLLELENEWHRFTTDDYKNFWNKLNQLQSISEMIDAVNPELMSAIQNMTLRMNNLNKAKIDEKGNIQNLGELFKILSHEVFKDSNIVDGMRKMAQDVSQAVNENSIPDPPSYVDLLEKAECDD